VRLIGLVPHADYLIKIQNNGKVEPQVSYNHLQFEPVTIDLVQQVIGPTETTARSKMGAGNMVNLVGVLNPDGPSTITQGEETDLTLDLSDIVNGSYTYEMTVADAVLVGQTHMPILHDVPSHFVTYDLDAIRATYRLAGAFKLAGRVGITIGSGGIPEAATDVIWVVALDGNEIFRSDLLTNAGVKTQEILQPGSTEEFVILPSQRFLTIASCDYDDYNQDWCGVGPLTLTTVVQSMITDFQVSDQSTGSTLFTNSPTVDVSMTVDAGKTTIDGYLVTESDVAPTEGWLGAAPATYTITGGEGLGTLYAWIKDSQGSIAGKSTTILFSTAVPVVSNVVVTDNGDGTATATWTTDIPAEGSVKYGPVTMTGATPNAVSENALRTSHSVTFATSAGTNYKIVLVNNEIASPAFYWPKPWPIDGDANGDCRVNILDLIFIRNKLNQPVGTGDNWKADVNEDTRINILDLIFVRNKLNTQCP